MAEHAVVDDRIIGIPGHVENLDAGTQRVTFSASQRARHLRHHHVGQQQLGMCGSVIAGAFCEGRFPHPAVSRTLYARRIPAPAGPASAHPSSSSTTRIVSEPGRSLGLQLPGSLAARGLDHHGQVYFEDRPLARLAIHPDAAFRLLDNPVNGCQAQACPLTLFLGCKEGFKYARLRLRRHSHSGVADRQHYVGTRLYRGVVMRVTFIQVHVAGFNRETPPVGMASRAFTARFMMTCSTCPGIRLHPTRERGPRMYGGMSSPIRRSTLSPGRNHLVQIKHLGSQHLAAAEGQQLAGEPAARSPGPAISLHVSRSLRGPSQTFPGAVQHIH